MKKAKWIILGAFAATAAGLGMMKIVKDDKIDEQIYFDSMDIIAASTAFVFNPSTGKAEKASVYLCVNKFSKRKAIIVVMDENITSIYDIHIKDISVSVDMVTIKHRNHIWPSHYEKISLSFNGIPGGKEFVDKISNLKRIKCD